MVGVPTWEAELYVELLMTFLKLTLPIPRRFVIHLSKASFPPKHHGSLSIISVPNLTDVVRNEQLREKAGLNQNAGRTFQKLFGQMFVFY